MKEVIVIYHNHLDPEWARCYDRPLRHNGMLLRSYADVWEMIIDQWLAMADEGFQYTEGQALVWKTYLRRHPEKADRLKKLIREDKLEILLQGQLTPETNYLPAEGLARNYILAKDFYEEFCGKGYDGLKFAFIWDAFGNSANMPQVLKLAGAEVVGGTKYRPVDGDFWIGIDGTKLPVIDKLFNNEIFGKDTNTYYGLSRHVICKACMGKGCPECEGKGMLSVHNFTYDEAVTFLEGAADRADPVKFVMIGGEETVPNHCILDAMNMLNEKHSGSTSFRFGDFSEFWQYHKPYFEKVSAEYTKQTEDLNPVHQGCYVTRIENKQRTRSISYALLQAEAAVASEMWNKQKADKAPEEFTLAWENLLLNMHHDSLSGAHIDGGQSELMDFLDESESIALQYTKPDRFTANRLTSKTREEKQVGKKQLGKMMVSYDREGILSVEKEGQDVFGTFSYQNMTFTKNSSAPVHIGELSVQCDWGDNHNAYILGDPVLLGKFNYSVYEGEDFIWWRGKHETTDPGIKKLEWEIRVSASEDGERLNFVTDVNWDTSNRRLRMLVPVKDYDSISFTREIPYGFIRSEFDADHMPPFGVDHATLSKRSIGEFPALHWACHEIDEKSGVAVLNKGIPSIKWIPGCFEVSLLRSPMMTGDTVLPSVDEIWDVDGTRDVGFHRFEYSIWPYTEGLTKTSLTKTGYEYNHASPEVPFQVDGNAVITAFKPSNDGKALVLRIQETEGLDSDIMIHFGREISFCSADLMEEPVEEVSKGKSCVLHLHRHEIRTIKLFIQ